ncbi:type IV secretion system protein VirB9 [Neorickettsia risticii str. Illinois]|uniref:Type IV secretion system protein VirB9 n=1 Tax=Neorickettsia risticii (strain Illinois) TaxID=434131 RepID=C6V478_NEORI|nr:TrbG/VirB9 family P-type conjugative transfer protein [Neorickettsia risticii]ACT69195.1 type IV secretion system protein VirB9 [Neorickettsia risticii str. Illinois]
MKRSNSFAILLTLQLMLCLPAFADQKARSLASTPHIKEIVYNPNGIHTYTGFFGYQSSIVFEDGEVISTISMGDSTGWQLDTQGNRLFLKPIEDNATTNVTILTSKRVYHFVFNAKEARDVYDPELAYEVRFRYPSHAVSIQNTGVTGMQNEAGGSTELDIGKKAYLNFEYKLSGYDPIKPLKVFDDGRFTYMQFPSVNANLPAVFRVDSQGYEALVNYHVSGKYLVVQEVAPLFTLRHGSDHVCVFNMKAAIKKRKGSSKVFTNG